MAYSQIKRITIGSTVFAFYVSRPQKKEGGNEIKTSGENYLKKKIEKVQTLYPAPALYAIKNFHVWVHEWIMLSRKKMRTSLFAHVIFFSPFSFHNSAILLLAYYIHQK